MLEAQIKPGRVEAGCDEVGRGCLAGPVVAAAVILPEAFEHSDLNDSKQLSESKRLELTSVIKHEALSWSVSFVEPVIIDRINILRASFRAMDRAISRLSLEPEHLLIDGNRFWTIHSIPFTCIIKGDSKNASIAAASILAKTYRDAYMRLIHDDFPEYNWLRNVGYPTKQHREAISRLGITPHHRKSFKLIPQQLSLSL